MRGIQNNSRIKALLVFVVAMITSLFVYAQPFIEEIRAFKKQDSVQMPASKANLFVGSSSLRLWKDIESDFPDHKIINRGFGGSSLPDVIRYAEDIIFPYDAQQIIIYCGENDLAASDTVTAQTVLQRFRQLFQMIRSQSKKIPVVFISIKPSPSRQHLLPKVREANALIKAFLETQKRTEFVDIFPAMLNAEGQPRKELFIDDMLHMNEQGYAIWKKEIGRVIR